MWWSWTNVCLLDVFCSEHATKLHAILNFCKTGLVMLINEVVFCRDSGNDMPVLAQPIQSVVVISHQMKSKPWPSKLVAENGHPQSLVYCFSILVAGVWTAITQRWRSTRRLAFMSRSLDPTLEARWAFMSRNPHIAIHFFWCKVLLICFPDGA